MTSIYIFNNASRAAGYGIGTYIRQLTDGMRGIPDTEVSLVEMYAETKEFAISDDEQGIRHYLIPPLHSGIESEDYCRCIFYFLARYIKPKDSDKIIFQFNYFLHYSLALLLKSWRPDSHIVFTVHYMTWCFELKGNVRRMKKITAEGYVPINKTEQCIQSSFFNEKAFLHLADVIITLSRRTEEILIQDYKVDKNKTHLVYNGLVDNNSYKENTDVRTILFVGRLDEIKGLKYLIDAFAKIVPNYPDAHLMIVGEGDFQPYLEQCRRICNRVWWMGKVKNEDLDALYRSAYIGVMPSFHEQCSYTAIEMMQQGIPLIGTNSTGLAEMFDLTPDLCIGIEEEDFNETDFVDEIVSRLSLLLSDKRVYEEASHSVRQLYEERYTLASMTNGLKNAIASLSYKGGVLSHDFLQHIDNRMIQLINQRPEIDTEFYGMSGIGVYLWYRINSLQETDDFQRTFLQEYMIYYIDWLSEAAILETLPEEMLCVLQDMKNKGFYKTAVTGILQCQMSHKNTSSDQKPILQPTDIIIQNALKISSCKV